MMGPVVGELQAAIEACRAERECVVVERDAFQQFLTRVQQIEPARFDPSETSPTNASDRSQAIDSPANSGDIALKSVLSAYKETILSVPHYRSGYEETLAENLTAELGEDIVTSLATNKRLTSAIQQAIVDRSQNAIDARTDLIGGITDEIDLLGDYQTKLSTIETRQQNLCTHLDAVQTRRSDAVFDIWCRLQELESELDEIVKQRQTDLRDPPVSESPSGNASVENADFYTYLYSESDAPQYPVLSAIGDLGTAIRRDKEQVSTHLG